MLKFNIETYWEETKIQDYSFITNMYDSKFRNVATQLDKCALLIQEGITYNLRNGLDIKGNPVKQKKSSGQIFVDTGLLLNSVSSRKVGNNEYEVFINSNRSKIASYLVFGREGKNFMTPREFFGIRPEVEKQIEKEFDYQINKIL